ncbi:MAG: MotA/TolQ/ExbB proton channel family protein [Myxococcales bacterium]|nr:MotA/TolQ/ExbB proton channel family protein [Myxococcales bacterium]
MNVSLPSLLAQATTIHTDPVSAALQSRGMVLAVLVLLVLMSVLTWFIIGARAWALYNLRKEIDAFRTAFNRHEDLTAAADQLKMYVALPHFKLLIALLKEIARYPVDDEADLSALERTMARASEPLVSDLEAGLTVLGSIASAAPFIGLFGTVWGIMMAFGSLSDSGSVLQTVAPHIAEALVATAVGLLAAIPAVIGYNALTRMVKQIVTDLDGFGLDLLNTVGRQQRGL